MPKNPYPTQLIDETDKNIQKEIVVLLIRINQNS